MNVFSNGSSLARSSTAVRSANTGPANGSAPAVEINAVSKTFPNGMRALTAIDLTIEEGEFLTLIGPSGCGKSTLLKMVANLTQPNEGKLSWWGGDFEQVGKEGQRFAFVFQEPTLMPWARVDANVRLPLDLAGMPRHQADPIVADSIARVGLSKFSRSFPRQLSGGMKMRVSIARALATSPNLLLMDEPFGALDEFTRNKLDADLIQLWWERRLTALFVTHSIYEAVFLSTRIVVLAANPGRIFDVITIDEPQPRGDAFRESAKFAAYCRELSTSLTNASLASHSAGNP